LRKSLLVFLVYAVLTTASSARAAYFYSQTSFWNKPVPSGAETDPNSAAMISNLVADSNSSGTPIAVKAYSVPIFKAVATTPRVNVSLDPLYNGGSVELTNVPIPPSASPAAGTDAHMMIWDKTTGCEYDFWRASKDSAGQWSAGVANADLIGTSSGSVHQIGVGNFPDPPGAIPTRGSSFQLGGGLILPYDFERAATLGYFPHALIFSMDPQYVRTGPVYPSSKSDGDRTGSDGLIPEGAHLQIRPGVDVSTLTQDNGSPLTTWQLQLAKTLQKYGMYLGDRGGGITLYAMDPKSSRLAGLSSSYAYPWGGETYADVPKSFYANMRVLTLGTKETQHYNLTQPPAICDSTFTPVP